MPQRPVPLVVALLGLAVTVFPAGAAQPPARAPHVEIDARGQVVSQPRHPVGKGGRQLLEFEIELLAYMLAPEQPAGADRSVPVEMTGRVRVLHDLSCGGVELALAVGDKVELRGVYVTAESGSLIRFTHAPGGEGCGDKAHPAGYLREVFPVTPTPAVTPPRPAVIVPDQSYVGTPAASEKTYVEILRMKQTGASDEKLLEKISAEKKVYSMSLEDIQKLRGAGVSTAVIEAMLQSGRRPITPGRKPAPSPTPGGSGLKGGNSGASLKFQDLTPQARAFQAACVRFAFPSSDAALRRFHQIPRSQTVGTTASA